MKNFKKLIKESYLGNPLNENKLPDGFHSQEDINQFFLDTVESGDVVVYKGEYHTVQRIEDDDLGVRVYIRPNERSYYGGRKDTFWVKPEDLESKEDFLDRMMKDQIEHDEETLRRERGLEEELNENKFDIAAKDEYGKPFAELSLKQKQELIRYMNKETEKKFETDYTKRRKGELDDKYDGMTDYQRGRMDENKFNVGDEIVYRGNQPGKVVHVFDYQSYINPSAEYKIRYISDSGNTTTARVRGKDIALKKDLDDMGRKYFGKDYDLDEGTYSFVDKSEARVNELDMNDPALVRARAAQIKKDERDREEAEYKAKQAALDKKYGSSYSDKLFAEIDLKQELADLEDEREDVLRNMEQEAEPEGGPIADDYGSILNDIDARMAEIKSELDDLRMYESVNEGEYRIEYEDEDDNRKYFTIKASSEEEAEQKSSGLDGFRTLKSIELVNEAEIPSFLTKNKAFEKAVNDSVNYNDFEKRVYHILGPKYFKLALTQQPGVFKDYYDSIRVTRPNLEEESDTDVGGGAKQAIGLDIDDAHSGDAALDDEVNKMGYNESKGFDFKQMVKEALTPNYLK